MSKKKTREIFSITILIIVVVAILGGLVYYVRPAQQTVFSGPPIDASGGIVCPDGNTCIAKPILKCEEATGSAPLVTFRCGENNEGESWFAIDGDADGVMECYSGFTNFVPSPQCNWGFSEKMLVPQACNLDKLLYVSNSRLFTVQREVSFNYCADDAWYLGTNCELSSTPVAGYEDRELTQGSSEAFSCSQNVFRNDFKIDTISYTGSTATPSMGVSPKEYELTEGDVFRYNGEAYFEAFRKAQTECNSPEGVLQLGEGVCSVGGDKLYTCDNSFFGGDAQLETEDCASQDKTCDPFNLRCAEFYTVDILVDGQNPLTNVQVIAGETIDVNVEIREPNPQRRNVIVTLSRAGAIIDQLSDNTNRISRTMTLNSPSITGYYDLTVSMQHEAKDFEKTYTVQVVQGVEAVVSSPNPVQFDNEPSQIKLETYQGGIRVPVHDFQFESTFRNSPIQPSVTRNPSLGIYEAFYNTVGEGTLRVRARVQKEPQGAWSEWSNYYEVAVKQASITITPTFENNVNVGTYTYSFTTRDNVGNFVDTLNVIEVVGPSNTNTYNARRTNTGNYEFDVTFSTSGLYYVKITSSTTSLGSTQLNDGQGVPVNVFKTGDDPTDADGGPNSLMWVLLGVLILGIRGFVFAIYKRSQAAKGGAPK